MILHKLLQRVAVDAVATLVLTGKNELECSGYPQLAYSLAFLFLKNTSVISIGNDVVFPIEVQTLLSTSNHNGSQLLTPASGDASTDNRSFNAGQEVIQSANSHIASNLAMQQPSLIAVDNAKDATNDEKDIMLEWHRNKPSIWQQYYGSKRLKYSNMVKKIKGKFDVNPTMMSYVSVENSMLPFYFIYILSKKKTFYWPRWFLIKACWIID